MCPSGGQKRLFSFLKYSVAVAIPSGSRHCHGNSKNAEVGESHILQSALAVDGDICTGNLQGFAFDRLGQKTVS